MEISMMMMMMLNVDLSCVILILFKICSIHCISKHYANYLSLSLYLSLEKNLNSTVEIICKVANNL